MAIRKNKSGTWSVDLRLPDGTRVRKRFKTRTDAARFERFTLSRIEQGKPWAASGDSRRLSDLVFEWYALHGINLRDGQRRLSKLSHMVKSLNNPVAASFKAAAFAEYRGKRLSVGISRKTLNNELGYLRAVFNELYSLGVIDYENPLSRVKPLQLQERSLTFLTDCQVNELLDVIQVGTDNPHVYPLTLICLATGCRWSEAESLTAKDVRSGLVTFEGTKSGRVRSVPVSDSLVLLIREHWQVYGPFTGSLSSFRRALKRCSFQLPPGQASHVLRHTFASRFVQSGGNLVALQQILGHSTINMTMRYSHLAPDHLGQAVKLNPVGQILGELEKQAGIKKP